MQAFEVLFSIAALSIALAGFAAIFRAFHSGKQVDGHSNVRINGIVEFGISITALSYLPIILQFFELSELIVYRYLSVLGVLYVLRWVIGLYAVRTEATHTPKTYLVAWIMNIAEIVLFSLAAINFTNNAIGFYLLAILLLFLSQCSAFIGQFFAESVNNS